MRAKQIQARRLCVRARDTNTHRGKQTRVRQQPSAECKCECSLLNDGRDMNLFITVFDLGIDVTFGSGACSEGEVGGSGTDIDGDLVRGMKAALFCARSHLSAMRCATSSALETRAWEGEVAGVCASRSRAARRSVFCFDFNQGRERGTCAYLGIT